MNTLEAIKTRRAVKHFDPAFKMPAADVAALEEAVALSPTAFNIQNWRLVKVTDPEQRKKIREAAWNQAQVTDASLLYILCADMNSWNRDPARYWKNAPAEVRGWMVENIKKYYEDKPQVQRDEGMRSCGIAAQSLMLVAKSLGYDSCPMDGFDFQAVGKLINLPSDHAIAMFVVVGKSTAPARERGGSVPMGEIFVENRF